METISQILNTILHFSLVDWHTHPALYTIQESLRWFLITGAIFIPLAMLFPSKVGQPVLHRGLVTDTLYLFTGPHVYGPVGGIIAAYLTQTGAIHFINTQWAFGRLPTLVQMILILLITDFFQYWLHRMFHGNTLWKFHAIHHSAEHVDWMTSARFHPINIIVYSTSVNAMVGTLGFTPEAFADLFLFNVIYSPLVHANLNWSYGPFKYLLASPVFHRWHHTHPDEGGSKNFAPTFPFLDLAFGTFYMPKGKRPEKFGTVDDRISHNILQHLVYPFLSTDTLSDPCANAARPQLGAASLPPHKR